MTDRLIITANIYTWYELIGFMTIILISMIAGFLISYRYAKEKKLSILFVTQPIVFLLFFASMSLFADEYFESIRNGYQQIGILIGLIIVFINLVTYSIELVRGKQEKVYDPDRVNRKHFTATLNSMVLITILGVSYGFVSPTQIGQVLLITAIATIGTLLLDHAFIIRLFRDPRDINKE